MDFIAGIVSSCIIFLLLLAFVMFAFQNPFLILAPAIIVGVGGWLFRRGAIKADEEGWE